MRDKIGKLREDFEKLVSYADLGINYEKGKPNVSNIREEGELFDAYQCLDGILDCLTALR